MKEALIKKQKTMMENHHRDLLKQNRGGQSDGRLDGRRMGHRVFKSDGSDFRNRGTCANLQT